MEKKLTDDQMTKVAGGCGLGVKHSYKEGEYVEFTVGSTMYCYHIMSLYPKSAESYKAYQATKDISAKNVYYSKTYVNFNGAPAGTKVNVYQSCPTWCDKLK